MDFNAHYKVRLAPAAQISSVADARRAVIFDATPDLAESRNVNYKMFDPVHAPGQIAVFQNTAARRFQLTQVKLISRTPREASINLAKLWVLRSWTMPTFGKAGESTRVNNERENRYTSNDVYDNDRLRALVDDISSQSGSYLGAPPPLLFLSAYSRLGVGDNVGTGGVGHLKKVPVVIESLNINYPSDVDYIPTEGEDPTPMPTVMNVDISLIESQSPSSLERFDLQKFKRGELGGF